MKFRSQGSHISNIFQYLVGSVRNQYFNIFPILAGILGNSPIPYLPRGETIFLESLIGPVAHVTAPRAQPRLFFGFPRVKPSAPTEDLHIEPTSPLLPQTIVPRDADLRLVQPRTIPDFVNPDPYSLAIARESWGRFQLSTCGQHLGPISEINISTCGQHLGGRSPTFNIHI